MVTLKTGIIHESISGIVDRVTYHNPENGWTVLRVSPFNNPLQQETVIVHQTKVFAGATMEFHGTWSIHPKHGRQFNATKLVEKKPATTNALEKYIGSGLIKGVGPKTAKKIVKHFDANTLHVFENEIERLTEVPGIAYKKLKMIREAWSEHKAIREVMMFLQSHGISTLFAVRIYKEYGDNAIANVTEDPYRLANDFYGIGFFSADKVALSIGLEKDSPQRIMAGIKHVLAASRDFGHCYLTKSQIATQVKDLLEIDVEARLHGLLAQMEQTGLVMVRELKTPESIVELCYYSKSLYFDELYVAKRIGAANKLFEVDMERVEKWINRYCQAFGLSLSDEQARSVSGSVGEMFSVLTGGPGCGKTTTTRVLVKLLEAMKKVVMLAAPTGRAAQRMTDVIGKESKTIHRLLGWQNGKFKKNEDSKLEVDFLIVDECSMLDINITAALLKAVPDQCQVLFIGDFDQLPSVGAGNVLKDIIASGKVACFRLSKIFRQARESLIIKYAHHINTGKMPYVDSPFKKPEMWQNKTDCLFIDSDEATQDQLRFIGKVKKYNEISHTDNEGQFEGQANLYEFRIEESLRPYETEFYVPEKFQHVSIDAVIRSENKVEELTSVLKKVHPWSSLRYGLIASDVVKKLYLEWIPKYYGNDSEIQILSPMTRGSLGTLNLNQVIQSTSNPPKEGKRQLKLGERFFREGDRVIHRRNNYDLGVFNGEIGIIKTIDNIDLTCTVSFFPDGRQVYYQKDNIVELDLAYAITIHKSQGSEFEIVIIPVLTQHFKMLFRNLIYTGLTRAKKLAVFVGTRKALAMAVQNKDTSQRQTALKALIEQEVKCKH